MSRLLTTLTKLPNWLITARKIFILLPKRFYYHACHQLAVDPADLYPGSGNALVRDKEEPADGIYSAMCACG